MKKKLLAALKYLILKDGMKVSVTKATAAVAGLCGAVVSLNGVLAQAAVAVPAEFIPIVKVAGIVSGFIAIIRVRNNQNPPLI